MSKKFFSLISGEGVHPAPGAKVIPSDAFSKLLDIKEAVTCVQEDGQKYRTEIASECEKLKEEAIKVGFEEGAKQWAEQLAFLNHEITTARNDISKIVIPLALKAAKKILGRELEVNKEAVIDIVKNNLRAVAQHKVITIYVNKKDIPLLEKKREALKEVLESVEVLSFRERDDITQGGCIIETEVGIINAQLENQWLLLEQAFESLMKSKG